MNTEELAQLCDDAVARLMEYADNVQILVSLVDDKGDTVTIGRGRGNYLARVCQCRQFAKEADDASLARSITEVVFDEDGETEVDDDDCEESLA